jgi:hypothetical protein
VPTDIVIDFPESWSLRLIDGDIVGWAEVVGGGAVVDGAVDGVLGVEVVGFWLVLWLFLGLGEEYLIVAG